jgi:hypothetical protein
LSNNLPNIGQVTTTRFDDLQIRLVRGGRSEGIPILLTSPWPQSIYAFRGVIPAIEALGPLIAIDLPGFGRSEGRADLMAPEAMGGFVVKVAEHLGIKRMHAVGGPDRQELLEGGHLIWEDAGPAYAEHLVAWLRGGYRSV